LPPLQVALQVEEALEAHLPEDPTAIPLRPLLIPSQHPQYTTINCSRSSDSNLFCTSACGTRTAPGRCPPVYVASSPTKTIMGFRPRSSAVFRATGPMFSGSTWACGDG